MDALFDSLDPLSRLGCASTLVAGQVASVFYKRSALHDGDVARVTACMASLYIMLVNNDAIRASDNNSVW